jgi:endonuclease-8
MPEGPSIVLAKEAMMPLVGKKVISVAGNTTIEKERAVNRKVMDIKSFGKHLLICFSGFTIRIHFLMFGSYLVNESKDTKVRLSLQFKQDVLNLYTCSVKILEGDVDDHYDWSGDVMNAQWNGKKALKKLREIPDTLVCDALLDQNIFAGVGNIIKNEVLYKLYIHPESTVGAIPDKLLNKLIKEASSYSFDFLKWKRTFELKKHWQAYAAKNCMRCELPFSKQYLGKTKRRTFFCNNCQVLYT